jgi:hypothetical protein
MTEFIGIEEHLDELKDFKILEVIAHCTGCNAGAVIHMTEDLDEAKEVAKKAEVIIRDDDTGEMHNYETAILEVKRKPIWVTKAVSDIDDISGLVQ